MYFWIVNCSLAFLLCVLCAGIVIPQAQFENLGELVKNTIFVA